MGTDANRFQNIIKYLPLLEDDTFGAWIIDRENDGTSDHPIQMPFVNYSEWCIILLKMFMPLLMRTRILS